MRHTLVNIRYFSNNGIYGAALIQILILHQTPEVFFGIRAHHAHSDFAVFPTSLTAQYTLNLLLISRVNKRPVQPIQKMILCQLPDL